MATFPLQLTFHESDEVHIETLSPHDLLASIEYAHKETLLTPPVLLLSAELHNAVLKFQTVFLSIAEGPIAVL